MNFLVELLEKVFSMTSLITNLGIASNVGKLNIFKMSTSGLYSIGGCQVYLEKGTYSCTSDGFTVTVERVFDYKNKARKIPYEKT